MDIRVNGKSETVPSGSTVDAVLAVKGLDPALISVEHNGRILEKSDLAGTALKDGDELESLFFMGGGEMIRHSDPGFFPSMEECIGIGWQGE